MTTTGHIVFDGPTRLAKYFLTEKGQTDLRHTIAMHDVGIADGTLADPYGRDCKAPPGMYFVGEPQACALRQENGVVRIVHDDDPAYGCFFTPLIDNPQDPLQSIHGRAGIGMHGGGSAAPDPFALHQGWYPTLGCLRMQNIDNEDTHVPFVRYVRAAAIAEGHDPDRAVSITVYQGPRG